jgi:hypothetical protein
MIVDRQACLYEHKENTFELSALRVAEDYAAIPTGRKELSALRAARDYEEIIVRGVAEIRNPDRITKKSRPNKRI